MIGLFAWSPWVQPTETDWLTTYEAWSDRIEAALGQDTAPSRAACESAYDDEVGQPPRDRLERVSSAARGGCATLSPDGWQSAQSEVVRALMLAHGDVLPPRRREDVARIADSRVGVRPAVYCWQPEAWTSFAQHYALVRGGEVISLRGIVDPARNRIDLDPGICAILDNYLERVRPSPLSYENFELAEALMVLTHQAERLRTPTASEIEAECYAVQHVRPLVRANGWSEGFAEEIALHGWEISYRQLPPRFRTPECRNDGRLDRNPTSDAWP